MSRYQLARALARVTIALAIAGCGDSPSDPGIRVATKLAFTVQPQNALAGAAIGPAVRVTLVDASGETVTSASGEVTLALAGGSTIGGATLAGTTFAEAVNGVATFPNLIVTMVGLNYTLSATATGLGSGTSASFDIGPAGVSSAVFTVQPSNANAGQSISPAIAVTLLDQFDNVATTSSAQVSLSVPSGAAPLFGVTTANPTNGVATFTNVSIQTAGTGYVILAQTSGVQAVSSAPFTVRAAVPSQLQWAQPPLSAEVMDLVGTPRVLVKDQYGNVVDWSNAAVTLSLASNPRSGILVGTTTMTAANGAATFENITIDRPGSYTIAATSPSLTSPAAVGLTMRLTLDTIVTGRYHSCGISVTGFNYCWGWNGWGQLGDATTTTRTYPVPVFDPFGAPAAKFKQLAAGGDHTCGLTQTGEAYCWGSNTYGQLGTGQTDGMSMWSPVPVTGFHTFVQIVAGGDHACGVGPGLFFGTGHCWGRNTHGQLGDGTTTARPEPTELTGWDVKSVSADSLHTCAVMVTNGQEGHCWGDNSAGQLGDGTKTQRTDPRLVLGGFQFLFMEAGTRHSCGVTNDASGDAMRCWGSNAFGQMGSGAVGGADVTSPTLVSGVNPFWISAAGYHTCNGNQCWGRNTEGQLGDGSTTNRPSPVLVQGTPNPPFPSFVDVGGRHSCAVLISTKVGYCWGSNEFGQLGDGTTVNRTTAVRVAP